MTNSLDSMLTARRAMDRIVRMNMQIVNDSCAEESEGLDGTMIVPMLLLIAVKDKTLVGEAIFFDERLPQETVASVARHVADKLDANEPGGEFSQIRVAP